MAKLTAASGGRSSPNQGPAMPRIRSVRTAARTMIGSWTNSMVDHREDLIARQTPAKTTPTPIKTASARRTSTGGWAVQIRNETAAMMAAIARPLTTGRLQGRAGRGTAVSPQAAPNKGSAVEVGNALSCLSNWRQR